MSPVRESPLAEQRRYAAQLGRRIVALRERHGYSRRDLANLTGITFKQMWEWERGLVLPRRYALELLARALGVKLSDLVA